MINSALIISSGKYIQKMKGLFERGSKWCILEQIPQGKDKCQNETPIYGGSLYLS